MPSRLLILLLAISCLLARFHCALEQGGLLAVCSDGDCSTHNAPVEGCADCPDLESNSTSQARKAPGSEANLLLLNLTATRIFSEILRLAPPSAQVIPGLSRPQDRRSGGPREALASLTTSLRGPPVQS